MSLVLKTVSDSKDAQLDLANLKKSVEGIEGSVKKVTDSFANMAKVISIGIGLAATVKTFLEMSDAMTNFENKLRGVTESQNDFNKALRGTKAVAIATRSDLNAIATLYSRIAVNSKDIGINQADTLRVTSTVAKALKISGASATEATAAITQFGQAIGSGAAAGDELRSLLENAPQLAKAMAKEFGVTVGQLKSMGAEGKLVASRVLKAILSGAEDIDKKFSKLNITFEGAFTNLGTSLQLLFAAASKSFFTSTGSIATYINKLAVGIANVAAHFDYYLLKIKVGLLFLVYDTIDAFTSLWETLKKTAAIMYDTIGAIFKDWFPTLDKSIETLRTWAIIIVGIVSAAFGKLASFISKSNLFDIIAKNFFNLSSSVRNIISTIFSGFTFKLPSLNVDSFFKMLEPATKFVMSWVKKIEGAFRWLYDKVIGHSWIPDLVIGVAFWLKKLLGTPLDYILQFTTKISSSFSKLGVVDYFAALVGKANAYRKSLFGVSAGVAAVAFNEEILNKAKDEKFREGLKESIADKPKSVVESATKKASGMFADFMDKTTFGRTLKQILGMKDTGGGTIFGTPVDPNSKVGRGTFRSQENRPFGHDVISALPEDWKIPVLASLTGIFALAITAAFESGTTRTVLLSALTTIFGVAVAKLVPESVIKETTHGLAYGFLTIVNKGLTALFSGNVIQDPFGFLSILAKSALLFKDGREALLKGATAIVTAPTKFGMKLGEVADRQVAGMQLKKAQKDVAALPQVKQAAFTDLNDALRKHTDILAKTLDANGRRIGIVRADAAIQTGQVGAFGTGKANKALEAGVISNKKLQNFDTNFGKISGELISREKELATRHAAMTDALKASAAAFKEGVRTSAATVGGTVLGTAGFQLATAFTETLGANTPAWQKVGIIIGGSVVGQLIGSGVGSLLASGIMGAIGLLGTMIMSGLTMLAGAMLAPFIAGAAIIGIALYAGWELWKVLPEEWKDQIKGFFGLRTSKDDAALKGTLDKVESGRAADGTVAVRDLTIAAKELREQGVKNTADISSNLNMLERHVIDRELALPSASEIADNKRSNREFIATVDKFSTTIGDWLRKFVPTGYAEGGSVTGPGTSTSDSVPAYLSAGEFVVNAKATRANFGLLQAINGPGARRYKTGGIARFDLGGQVTAPGSFAALSTPNQAIPVKDPASEQSNVILKAIEALLVKLNLKTRDPTTGEFSIKVVLESLKDLKLPGITTPTLPGVPGAGTAASPSNYVAPPPDFKERVGKSSQEAGGKMIIEALGKAGVAGAETIEFSKVSSENTAKMVDVLNIIARLTKEKGRFGADKAMADAKGVLGTLIESMKESGEAKSSLKGPAAKELKDKDIVNVGEQFDIINKAFPKLNLTLEEFNKMQDETRDTFYETAREVAAEDLAISKIKIGPLSDPGKKQAVFARKQENEERRKSGTKELQTKIAPERKPFAALQQQFAEMGETISDEVFNLASSPDFLNLEVLRVSMADAMATLKAPASDTTVTDAARKVAQETVNNVKKQISETTAAVLLKSATSFEQFNAGLGKFGLSVSESIFNRMSDAEKLAINTATQQLATQKSAIAAEENPALRKKMQSDYDKFYESMGTYLSNYGSNKAAEAGKAFASDVNGKFNAALSNALRGTRDEGESTWGTFVNKLKDDFSNSVINTFSTSVTDSIMGPGSIAGKGLAGIGAGIAGIGGTPDGTESKPFSVKMAPTSALAGAVPGAPGAAGGGNLLEMYKSGGVSGALGGVGKAFQESFKEVDFGKMWSQFSTSFQTMDWAGMWGAVTNAFNKIDWTQLLKLFGMAEGGVVSGPGTSTSDSIPAALSAGEFVVNARAAKGNIGLLHQLNSGKIARLAAGGLISTAMVASPSIAKVEPTTNGRGNTQVINIGINGDISRQTRSEIFQMLPSIAEGVNVHNKEKGYKG